jgi:septum formation protein
MSMGSPKIYLASASPRRAELLTQIGVEFEVLRLGEYTVDESVHGREAPLAYVKRLARAKAVAGVQAMRAQKRADRPVLAADTTVCLGRIILGKPEDAADARRMLTLLSGRTHRVLTAIAVARDRSVRLAVSDSRVTFAKLSRREIDNYVASGESLDKAGAYGIQGRAGALITHLSGSYFGVMGLPLHETIDLLKSHHHND